MEFKNSETRICTARAFAGLCQDSAKYQLMAKSAETEGYGFLAKLFMEYSKHKMAHASSLYTIMIENINCKKDNISIEAGFPFENYKLAVSIEGSCETEKYEGKNLFPHFAKIAHDEGFLNIEKKFNDISKVCLKFSYSLEKLATKFKNNQLFTSTTPADWRCTNCGHEDQLKSVWKNCPLCNYPQGYAKQLDEGK